MYQPLNRPFYRHVSAFTITNTQLQSHIIYNRLDKYRQKKGHIAYLGIHPF